MYNYKLAKIDPLSVLKYSIFAAVSISVIYLAVDILWLVIKTIIALFTSKLALIVLEQGGVQFFFTIILLMLLSIGFGLFAALLSIIYNYSSKWFNGIKVYLEEHKEVKTDESVNESRIR